MLAYVPPKTLSCHCLLHCCRLDLSFWTLIAAADINQYDISDPENPKHVGRVWVGGSIQKGSGVTVTEGAQWWLRHVFAVSVEVPEHADLYVRPASLCMG